MGGSEIRLAPTAIMLNLTTCPLCKCPVRIARREDGAADHYEFIDEQARHLIPNPISPILADFLRASRKGKKTVAIVGAGWNTAAWAPWGEDGVEVWGMNESHGYPWFDVENTTRWFQIHPKVSFTKEHKCNHWGWLREEHPFLIYMDRVYDDVPSSTKYPLRDIQNKLINNFYRGEEKVEKLFSSTCDYEVALALLEGFERIELYGIEMVLEGEYAFQREGISFWIGKAEGMGVELWIPEKSSLLVMPLYACEEIRDAKSGQATWSAGEN